MVYVNAYRPGPSRECHGVCECIPSWSIKGVSWCIATALIQLGNLAAMTLRAMLAGA